MAKDHTTEAKPSHNVLKDCGNEKKDKTISSKNSDVRIIYTPGDIDPKRAEEISKIVWEIMNGQ